MPKIRNAILTTSLLAVLASCTPNIHANDTGEIIKINYDALSTSLMNSAKPTLDTAGSAVCFVIGSYFLYKSANNLIDATYPYGTHNDNERKCHRSKCVLNLTISVLLCEASYDLISA